MWISEKKWNALQKRVEALEEKQCIASANDGLLWASTITSSIPINQVVCKIANILGVKYMPGTKPQLVHSPSGDSQP